MSGDIDSALEQAVLNREIDGEMIPLGVYANRVRAGGSGIGAFDKLQPVLTQYTSGVKRSESLMVERIYWSIRFEQTLALSELPSR